METKPNPQKDAIIKHLDSLKRFNQWEKKHLDTMDDSYRFSAIFELYELIPKDARKRDINVEGIVKMRKALACLK
jgi:hypothetical protein